MNSQKQIIVQQISKVNGQKTCKRYQKKELLGRGGFANCYVYQSIQNNKRFATKIIRKQMLLLSNRTKIKLMNQIKLHKSFHHQNIVQFVQVFEDQDNIYILLQLCENQALDNFIKKKKPSIPEIRQLMKGLVKGVRYLHNQKIIHRDLKLANIFLDKELNVKIGDFGLATKIQFKNEKKRTICGTPNYIAPQIIQGQGYSFEIDIWSIGVILYTLLIGIPPFQTQDVQETYKRIKKGTYQFPELISIPLSAKILIKKILQVNPSKRYTLDDILQSEFMQTESKLQKFISPNKTLQKAMSQNQISFMKSTKDMWKSFQCKQKSEKSQKIYIDKVQINQKYLLYSLNNGTVGIKLEHLSLLSINQDQFMVIRHKQKDIIQKYQENQLPSQFRLLSKQLNIFKQGIKQNLQNKQESSSKQFTYLKRFIKNKEFSLFRYSNQTVHMKFQDGCQIIVTNKNNFWMMLKNGNIYEDILQNYLQLNNEFSKKKKYVTAVFQKINILQKRTSWTSG